MPRSTEFIRGAAGATLEHFGKNLFNDIPESENLPSPEELKAENPSLYIHIPFCHPPLCEMCPFCRQNFSHDQASRYMEDLRTELSQYPQHNFSTVYVGGGTPATVIEPLMELISEFGIGREELSIEAHPYDLSPRNLEIMKKGGVKRLSVGVQSFDPHLLELMKRNNGPDPIGNLKRAQESDIQVNADLIYNFAGQTVNQFLNDVHILMDCGVSQITCYPLMAAPGSFNKVDNSKEKEYYAAMLGAFKDSDYSALTPWCFALSDKQSQGEYISSGSEEYLGIGISSISKLGSYMTINTFDLDEYHQEVNQGQKPIVGMRQLKDYENIEYLILTSLFGMSMDLNKLTGNFVQNSLVRGQVMALQMRGYVTVQNQTARLTEEGMYFFSGVMKDFYTGLNFYRDKLKNPS